MADNYIFHYLPVALTMTASLGESTIFLTSSIISLLHHLFSIGKDLARFRFRQFSIFTDLVMKCNEHFH